MRFFQKFYQQYQHPVLNGTEYAKLVQAIQFSQMVQNVTIFMKFWAIVSTTKQVLHHNSKKVQHIFAKFLVLVNLFV